MDLLIMTSVSVKYTFQFLQDALAAFHRLYQIVHFQSIHADRCIYFASLALACSARSAHL